MGKWMREPGRDTDFRRALTTVSADESGRVHGRTETDACGGHPSRPGTARSRGAVEAVLRESITCALHQGRLRPGARLPSARHTAEELGVDRRTVVAALRALARDGLVELRSRSGVFVARPSSPRAGSTSRAEARAESAALDYLARGVAAGVSLGDLVEALASRLRIGGLRALCVSDNADQGEAICAAARHMFGFVATWVDARALGADRPLPPGARAAQYVLATPPFAGAARRLAGGLGVPVTLVAPRADRIAPLLEALTREPVYFIGTDPRFAEAVARQFADAPREHVRPLIVGCDDLRCVRPGAAVYRMSTAAARLGAVPPHWRVLPRVSAFSPESAQQVLAAMLRLRRSPGQGGATE